MRRCLVSTCCRWRLRRAAQVASEHPLNVFLPQSVARDHAVEIAFAAAESAELSAANARRSVDQLMHCRRMTQEVAREAAAAAARRATELELVEVPNAPAMCGSFTIFDMTRVGRELVRANSA